MTEEISIPVWLLADESVSPEMLRVYAKMKAKIPLQEREKQTRSQLVAKGLVRASNGSLSGSEGADVAPRARARRLGGSTTQTAGSDPPAGSNRHPADALTKELVIPRTHTSASTNNYKQAPAHEEPSTGREFTALTSAKTKIRRFQTKDNRPFKLRWAEFWKECNRVHRENCLTVIRFYLQEKLQQRAEATGVAISLDSKDWKTVQAGHARALFNQYPLWQEEDWKEAIDWFLNDDFWSSVIIDVKALRKNINRFVVWKQRREPQKKKFKSVNVIGRKK